MKTTREEKIELITYLINQLGEAFDDLGDVTYKIMIESYDKNRQYVVGAEESNNWDYSFC